MLKERKILPSGQGLRGEIFIPGDKSVSHRSVMFSSLGDRAVTIKNFLRAQDCMTTVNCMRSLGIAIEEIDSTTLKVHGRGLQGLKEPADVIDAGNSGTTLRLMMGILAAQPFLTTFTGDASLRKRPLARVIAPLKEMNAKLVARRNDQLLPLTIVPSEQLKGISYQMPMASAQVKSAILLAGLYASGETTVIESHASRDHTEKMLMAFGAKIKRDGLTVTVARTTKLTSPDEIVVPGDISSAAFWLVAASIIPGSDLTLRNVGVNATRTGVIDVLKDMGADIMLTNERTSGGELIADIRVKHAKLRGTTIGGALIPRLVDEIPVLTVAAMFAEGRTIIGDAGELRVKETDRLAAIAAEFNKFADCISENVDGLVIEGGKKFNEMPECFSYHDHRIAMALAIAGAAGKGVFIMEPECVKISYPDFYATLTRVQAAVEGKMNNFVIAIDGPAGAGKSTVARLAAQQLNYTYIDTGAMYRAAAWLVLEKNLPVIETADIENAVADLTIKLSYASGCMNVSVNGTDVTAAIRTPAVTALVSRVAQVPKVRQKLVMLQQEMAKRGAVVMDGRDICTHVLPQANVKVFLTASIEERAKRRYKELQLKGYLVSLKELQSEIAARDKADSERLISPLIQAPDAVLLDTTKLMIDEAVDEILKMVAALK